VAGRTLEEIKKEYGIAEVYKMASNENLYGLPPGLAERISEDIGDIYYYPDSSCLEIKEKLSRFYGIGQDKIVVGCGSDQIIEMICDSFTGPGDNIVTSDPTFPIYEKSALKCGGESRKVPLKGFRQDTGRLLEAVDENTKVLFLTNPHNPTGTNITRDELDAVLDRLDRSILLVIDEAYFEYCPREDRLQTTEFLAGRDNLMLLRTFSKIYGLAGLRIGYGLGSGEAVDAINKVRLPFNVNSMAQKAAVYALDYAGHAEEICEKVNRQKQVYYNALDENNIEYVRSYANFLLISTGKKEMEIVEELLRNGFIVRPGTNLGFPGYIRVTIATDEVNKRFLDVFTGIYRDIYKQGR